MIKKLFSVVLVLSLLLACTVSKLPLNVTLAPNASNYVKDSEKMLFANFHGLKTSSTTAVLEGEGMTFIIEKVDLPPSKKAINKIKNAYMPNGDIFLLENTTLSEPNMVLLGGEAIAAQYSTTSLLVIAPAPDSTTYAIEVESAFMLDFDNAGKMIKDIINNGLPGYVMTDGSTSTVDFAGRQLKLGNVCQWIAPHHIGCSGLGSLQWSLYNSDEDAKMSMQINMAISEAQSPGVIEKKENVRVGFEDLSVLSTKVIYKNGDGSDNNLTAYYIATRVRGLYLFCKVSFTAEETTDQKLSPLAAKVISL